MGGGKGKSMTWSAVVHVVLVQAHGLTAMDAGMSSDPYCKLSLGKEKFKSKTKSETINPKWREAFDFNWYEEFDTELEVAVFDKDVGSKDDFMGRYYILWLDAILTFKYFSTNQSSKLLHCYASFRLG